MTAAKQKSIILDAVQVRRVQEHGKLVRFVVMDEQPSKVKRFACCNGYWSWVSEGGKDKPQLLPCPFAPGERVWCKEEYRVASLTVPGVISKTGEGVVYLVNDPVSERSKSAWRPAGVMPQHHSRLTLELASVEPVRIKHIVFEDFRAAGCDPEYSEQVECADCRNGKHSGESWHFLRIWNSAHAKPEEKWDANPWCWKEQWTKVEADDA